MKGFSMFSLYLQVEAGVEIGVSAAVALGERRLRLGWGRVCQIINQIEWSPMALLITESYGVCHIIKKEILHPNFNV